MTAGPPTTSSPSTSAKNSLARLVSYPKQKPFRVMILGQSSVGKSALTVRFITRKFIGEYDPNLEKIYSHETVVDNETVLFEILDSAGDTQEKVYSNLEHNIRWAEAFILLYAVTDRCSFEECQRLKFLINHSRRRRRLNSYIRDSRIETPVVLVGNKTDLVDDRMVTTAEGKRCSQNIGCVCFHEISVRESIEQAVNVFNDARRFWRVGSKWSRKEGDRYPSLLHLAHSHSPTRNLSLVPGEYHSDDTLKEEDESLEIVRCDSTSSCQSENGQPFRARASTDSRLQTHPSRGRHPSPQILPQAPARRMSFSMKGNNSSTF